MAVLPVLAELDPPVLPLLDPVEEAELDPVLPLPPELLVTLLLPPVLPKL